MKKGGGVVGAGVSEVEVIVGVENRVGLNSFAIQTQHCAVVFEWLREHLGW